MTKIKATKRSLIGSIMALVFCCSIFLGTTFAWFTDTATTGVNKVQAGNLDVDLVNKNGVSLVGKNLEFIKAQGGQPVLWEPGCTYRLPEIYVRNNGNLALKYKIAISGIANGDAKLLEAIKFTIKDQAGETIDLSDFEGYLTGKETSPKGLVIEGTMKASAGNEYQGLSIEGIAITVYATQDTVESDSTGNEYDDKADYPVVIPVAGGRDINTAVKLENTMKEINDEGFESKQVVLNPRGMVTWTTGGQHGSTPLVTADNEVVEEVIIDGGNFNNATMVAIGAGVGPIRAANDAILIFRNLTIVDKSISYAEGSWEFGYLEFGGKLRFENCVFTNPIQLGSDAEAEFINCTFTSDTSSMYSVWMHDGSASFKACTFNGYRGLKIHEAYSSNVNSVIVDNCTFGPLSVKPGIAIGTVDSTTVVTIKNSTFDKCQAGDQSKYMYETDTPVNNFKFTELNNTVIN